jgi:hypothetical protein
MLLKSADDKSKRLHLLEELQNSNRIDARQHEWLRNELSLLRKGIQGERDSAYYLDNYFKDGKNHVLLHDLRFIVDEEVAQIDHLIINRAGGIYLLETKNYACNLVINEHGEFTAEYGERRFGVESPLEQSRRHERVLCKLLEQLAIGGRTQKRPEFYHVVMLHPKAIIQRPNAKTFDASNVIKADAFPSWHQQFVDKLGVGTVLSSMFNLRSLDTLKEWGEKLMRQHRPADLLVLPEFMQPHTPKPTPDVIVAPVQPQQAQERAEATPLPSSVTSKRKVCAHCNAGISAAVSDYCQSHVQRFGGQVYCMEHQALFPAPVRATLAPNLAPTEPVKQLICAHCGSKISYAEGKFCWNNQQRFGGLAYCREHQAIATPKERISTAV